MKDLSIFYKQLSKLYTDQHILKPKYFDAVEHADYYRLYKNLTNIFGYLENGPTEPGDWNSSTVGWHQALRKTLGEKLHDDLYEDLEWYDLDFLDGEFEDRLDKWFTQNKRKE